MVLGAYPMDNYQTEDTIYYCICEAAESAGLDVPLLLSKNEQFLIENKTLKGGSGQDYYDYCDSIAKHPPRDVAFNLDFGPSFTSASDVKVSYEKCCNRLNVRENTKMKRFDEIVKKYHNRGISVMAEEIIHILTPEDLNHDLYKLKTVMALVDAATSGMKLERILPPDVRKTTD